MLINWNSYIMTNLAKNLLYPHKHFTCDWNFHSYHVNNFWKTELKPPGFKFFLNLKLHKLKQHILISFFRRTINLWIMWTNLFPNTLAFKVAFPIDLVVKKHIKSICSDSRTKVECNLNYIHVHSTRKRIFSREHFRRQVLVYGT